MDIVTALGFLLTGLIVGLLVGFVCGVYATTLTLKEKIEDLLNKMSKAKAE